MPVKIVHYLLNLLRSPPPPKSTQHKNEGRKTENCSKDKPSGRYEYACTEVVAEKKSTEQADY